MGKNGDSAKIICAICYEDVKPLLEDLQSVSLCGHVFHELCLQQWLEYCPPNKKATCPVCKHSCSGRDVHRLYFQSTSEQTQQSSASQRSCAPDSESAELLRETVKKLECQLGVASAALESQQHHMRELSEQLSLCQDRAEKAEVARAKSIRDKVCSEESLVRKQEELARSTTECSRLWEKNTALAKELAAHKLVANLDLEEDQVLKLACVGRGSNKDDIIDTLKKSLVIRNKNYKELMEKCNQLGMGENHSIRKLEKAVERIKRLKARIQELERTLEEKENASIRLLVKPNITQFKMDKSAINKTRALNTDSEDLGSNMTLNDVNMGFQKSQGPVSEIDLSAQDYVHSSIMHTEKLPDFGVGNVTNIRSDKNVNEHIFHGRNEEQPGVYPNQSYPLTSKCASPGVPDNPVNSSDVFPDLERVDNSKIDCNVDEQITSRLGQEMELGSMGIIGDNSFLPIKREAGLAHLASLLTNEEPTLEGCVVSKGVNGIAGKWCRQAKNLLSSSGQGSNAPSSGTFIAVGANGRGGQIKVLKNPNQSLDTGLNSLWTRQPKRCKTQKGKPTVNNQGALQIEHFFQKSSQT